MAKKTIAAFEIDSSGITIEFKVEILGTKFIITRSQGGEFKPCDKFGLWTDEPHLYRNNYLANLAIALFESQVPK